MVRVDLETPKFMLLFEEEIQCFKLGKLKKIQIKINEDACYIIAYIEFSVFYF